MCVVIGLGRRHFTSMSIFFLIFDSFFFFKRFVFLMSCGCVTHSQTIFLLMDVKKNNKNNNKQLLRL